MGFADGFDSCRSVCFQVLDSLSCFVTFQFKRNLHYLAMGFGLTAMLTVLYSNVTSLGGAVAGLIGTLPAEVAETIGFANNFKGLSMIGISIVGIFLAVVHFKNSQKVAVAAPSTQSESGEIEDDEILITN